MTVVAIRIKDGKILSVNADTDIWYAIIDDSNKDFHIFSVEGNSSVGGVLFGDIDFNST